MPKNGDIQESVTGKTRFFQLKTPYFIASFEMESEEVLGKDTMLVTRCPPIIRYMQGWSAKEVSEFVLSKQGWRIIEMDKC